MLWFLICLCSLAGLPSLRLAGWPSLWVLQGIKQTLQNHICV